MIEEWRQQQMAYISYHFWYSISASAVESASQKTCLKLCVIHIPSKKWNVCCHPTCYHFVLYIPSSSERLLFREESIGAVSAIITLLLSSVYTLSHKLSHLERVVEALSLFYAWSSLASWTNHSTGFHICSDLDVTNPDPRKHTCTSKLPVIRNHKSKDIYTIRHSSWHDPANDS